MALIFFSSLAHKRRKKCDNISGYSQVGTYIPGLPTKLDAEAIF